MSIGGGSSYLCDGYIDKSPCKSTYFKDFIADGKITIDDCKEVVNTILSVKTGIEVQNTTILQKEVEIKSCGQIYLCRVVMVELKISFQVKYIGGLDGKSVFIEQIKFFKNIYITIPLEVDSNRIDDLFRKSKYVTRAYIEDAKTDIVDCKFIKYCIVGLVDIDFIVKNKLHI